MLAVNKMDLVDWSEEVFDRIVADFDLFASQVGLGAVWALPMSALHGDNVVESSERLGWYAGPPLLEHLETLELPAGEPGELRFPVQWVLRDPAGDGRAYAGRVAGGELRPGAEVVALPAGVRARVIAVETLERPARRPRPPGSRCPCASTATSTSGAATCSSPPSRRRCLRARSRPTSAGSRRRRLRPGARLALKHGTATVRAVVDEVVDRLDLTTSERAPAPDGLALNDIGRVRLRVSRPLPVEPYAANRVTGAFVLIDEGTNDTVGAGMISA